MKNRMLFLLLSVFFCSQMAQGQTENQLSDQQKTWLSKANRHEKAGWIYVHIEGEPKARGFQHGYLLASEIKESLRIVGEVWHYQSAMDWKWLVNQSAKFIKPKVDAENVLEMEGIEALLQGVTPPTVEYTEHKQGRAGNKPDRKTPGKKIVGDLTVEMVVSADTGSKEVWLRFQNTIGTARASYIGTGFLVEANSLGIPINRYFIGDVWVKKIETSQFSTKGDNSADVLRTVTFSVEDFILQ